MDWIIMGFSTLTRPSRTLLGFVSLMLALGAATAVGAQEITYTYDGENRLTRADYGDGNFIEYTYDDLGNRTRRVIQFALPEPSISVGNAQRIEGDSGTRWARFAVSLSNPSATETSFDYQSMDGSAQAGQDYLALSSTLHLPPGTVHHEIRVEILGDTEVEPAESFFLNFSNPTGASLTTTDAVGLIEDDDRRAVAQTGTSVGHGVNSQNFETVQDAWDSLAAEDFTLAETLRLTRIRVHGFYSEGGGPADSAGVFLFSDAGGVPGATVWSDPRMTPEDLAGGSFLLDLPSPLRLDPGTYWLAVQANMDIAAGGQWFWREQLLGQGSSFQWRNPGDGFATGCTEWQGGMACGVGENPALGFELFGTAEPAFSIADVDLIEGDAGATDGVFSVVLSGAVDQAVQVSYATSDSSAIGGVDYETRSGTLVFPAGHTTETIVVPVLGDQIAEEHETFFVDLSSPLGAPLADARGLGTIEDDDASRLSIDSVAMLEGEGGTTEMVFTVTLDPISSQDVSVGYATVDGAARAGDDYTATSGTIEFSAGTSSQTLTVTVLGDELSEVDESFRVLLSDPVHAFLLDGEGIGLILDDDALIDQTVNSTSGSQTSQNFEPALDAYDSRAADDFTLIQPSILETVEVRGVFSAAGPVTSVEVAIYVDDGGLPAASALSTVQVAPRDPADPDFVLDLPAPLPLAAGTYWLSVVANLDAAAGGQWFWRQQTVTTGRPYLWQNPGDGFGTGCTTWSVASVACGAGHPDLAFRLLGTREPSLFIDDLILIESEDAEAVFTLSLSPASAHPVVVDFATTEDSALAGVDFVAGSGSVSFDSGETHKTITVAILDNGVAEPTERFFVDLSSATGAPVAKARGEGLLTRELFAQVDRSVDYGITAQDFDALNDAFDSQAADDFEIGLDVLVERIQVEGFFTSIGGRTLVQGVDVRVYADAVGQPAADPVYEALDLLPKDPADSDFLLELPAPMAFGPGFYWLSLEANLDYAGGNRRWFWRQQAAGGGLPFLWRNPVDGFGTGCVDWTAAGACGATGDDGLTLRLLGSAQPSLFIEDVTVVPGDAGTVEAVLAVHLQPASLDAVSVDYATEDGTAVAGEDYVAESGSLSFAPGETYREVRIGVLGSVLYEPTEEFSVRLGTVSGASVIDDLGVATVIRRFVDLSSSPGTTGVTSQDFEAEYDAYDSQAADDFTLSQPVTVERIQALGFFTVGEGPLGSVDVWIYADDGGRPAATPLFSAEGLVPADPYDPDLDLVLPSAWSLGAGTHWLSLEANMDFSTRGRWFWRESSGAGEIPFVWRNPAGGFGAGCAVWTPAAECIAGAAADLAFALLGEVQPGLFVDDLVVTEGDGGPQSASFAVRVYPAGSSEVTVDYATQEGSAVAGEDFVAVQGSLSFPAWTSERIVDVPIVGDVLFEGEEDFALVLSLAAGVPLADGVGVARILDDDTVAELAIGDAEISEGDAGGAAISFPVTLSAPSPIEVRVDYLTVDDTAHAGSDYAATSGSLTFAPGVTEQLIAVTVTGDVTAEAAEVFQVELRDAEGAPIGRALAWGTVFDDDALVEAFGEASSFAVPSQNAEPLFDLYDAQAADRFELAAPSRLETVEVDGVLEGFSGAPPELTSMDVWIYPDVSGPAEPALYEATALVPADGRGGRRILTLPSAPVLPVGAYWISVRANLDLADGRWSWRGHVRDAGTTYRWRNPLDGFGSGCTTWTAGVQCHGEAPDGLGFRLLGRRLPVIEVAEVQMIEGDLGTTDAVFTLTLSEASDESVSVDYATLDGTAVQSEDYQSTSGSHVFAPGTTSHQVPVPVLGDPIDEPRDSALGESESFLLRLQSPHNAVLGSSAAAVGVILDDDPAPFMSIGDATLIEGTGSEPQAMVFQVELSIESAREIAVWVDTLDGTATAAGGDYLPVSGPLTFAPGTVSRDVMVLIAGDDEPEDDETFTVVISDPVHVALQDASATGEILDDDASPCTDSDADGTCDDVDTCPGSADDADADGDAIPDGCDSCPGGLTLTAQEVISTVVYESCASITASDGFHILASGNVTFRAAGQVVLGDGFFVETGGKVKIETDPALAPP